ncbi:hypothetical protein DFJ58DRAFT_739428 [Suillus subalutaceus]|uniref:uncharacterized protein n=1 Tax=Suillus subalutaceus TaxID=48586 RepID=UPI001B879A7F|nr:uncharacterized protein DFJ58DRAFT_739428 [Suillus subalutaceus]KAG1819398.1 hypothetical protein DFJ58DRAFT_739428 [Suillus subalutaceus]
MLGEKMTAREQCEILRKCFACLNITSLIELRTQLLSEQLKDAEDASRYLSVFENGRRHFAEMGVIFTDEEAIWIRSSTSTITPILTFEEVAASFFEEANRQRGQLRLAKSSSDAHVAITFDCRRGLSFAVVKASSSHSFTSDEDIPSIAHPKLSAILGFGTMSTLITDRDMFWTRCSITRRDSTLASTTGSSYIPQDRLIRVAEPFALAYIPRDSQVRASVYKNTTYQILTNAIRREQSNPSSLGLRV